ncbi:ATP-binding protein [Leptospira kmetyi]|uniref:histidine kinase n=1 Tax=Leptospira kmetyi TaxID=408139 RepID=A0ABX4N9X4_9LEPT|nr:ATP-binding protein [Leptospira kmetyi]EQA55135.1 GHKL domain protein [Leptospira kmetyi serovar Malaysia str. Bejo-Iso9]PJZ30178.1 hypothetical protein CH378_09100 [Leptospira kmetyi]PJZ41502.1 hypothetical protein CH370_12010 [Leptospira kmetyi]TGL66661.1 HAMP domain-containing protein [Leptospira kmetyi]
MKKNDIFSTDHPTANGKADDPLRSSFTKNLIGKKQKLGIRTRISVILAALLSVGALLVTTINSVVAYQRLKQEAESGARLASEKYTREISQFLNVGLGAVRGFKSVLEKTRPNRPMLVEAFGGFLHIQPDYFGVWAVFEPNAFDGLDNSYRNAKGHDASGRFVPYINRALDEDKLVYENCVNYEDPGPKGLYYSVPRQTQKEFLTEPTSYLVSGKSILMVSIVAPVFRNSKFAGVVGVDVTIERMQTKIGSIRPFRNQGYLAFLSPDGSFAANGKDPSTVGKQIAEPSERKRITDGIASGQPFLENKDGFTHYYYPVLLGDSPRPWAVRVSIPDSLYSGDLIYLWFISLVSTFVILGMILLTLRFSFDRYVLKGLSKAIAYSEQIAKGNLSARAHYPREDEIGALLGAMDKMREDLSMYLEERIATQAALRESEEIRKRNELIEAQKKHLEEALENLRKAQNQLLHSVRMATLGQLSAGISHELNNPLGAIKASNQTLLASVPKMRSMLPEVHSILSLASPEERKLYISFIDACRKGDSGIAGLEVRRRRKNISNTLKEWDVPNSDALADTIADMGVENLSETYKPLFQMSNRETLLEYIYLEEIYFRNSDTIRVSVDRASKILFELRNYSEAGDESAAKKVHIEETLETVFTVYQHYIRRGVDLTRSIDEIPPVLCVREEIVQVWTHLIFNALQAMQFKGKLTVRLFQREKEAIVEIEDNGPGIPDEIRDKIFEPFFTTKDAGEGSGLGLDLVRKLLDKNEGRIEFISEPGKTVFRVFLPLN